MEYLIQYKKYCDNIIGVIAFSMSGSYPSQNYWIVRKTQIAEAVLKQIKYLSIQFKTIQNFKYLYFPRKNYIKINILLLLGYF